MIIGIVIAVLISASIPLSVGFNRGQPALGIIGAICAIPAAILLGCLGGLPVAAIFTIIIMALSSNKSAGKKRRKKPRPRYDDEEDDEEEEEDRPRRRRRRDEDDDEEDDRPRGRRGDY